LVVMTSAAAGPENPINASIKIKAFFMMYPFLI